MGIDVFMSWGDGPSFEGNHEHVFRGANGYLREAYHGGPYATVVLVPEAFGDPRRVAQWFGVDAVEDASVGADSAGYALIPANVLRARLPPALLTIARRYRAVYDEECGEALDRPVGVLASW